MFHKITKFVLFTLVIISLNACATRPTYNIGIQATANKSASNATTTIIDKRPTDDRESSMGSMIVTSSNYGIYTLGDERFVPAPITALNQRLQNTISTSPTHPQSITVTVNRFNIQLNIQAAARHSAVTSAGLTSLGMDLSELIMGKLREQNVDLRKPFVLCVFEATADIEWNKARHEPRKVSVIKAQNYDELTPQDKVGQIVTATVAKTLDAVTGALTK